jgi:hypothetical protein
VTRRVCRGKREIELAPKEFALLEFLMRRADRPLTRRVIAAHVWGMHWDRRTNVIDVVISNLRKKIEWRPERRLLKFVRAPTLQKMRVALRAAKARNSSAKTSVENARLRASDSDAWCSAPANTPSTAAPSRTPARRITCHCARPSI